MQAMVMPLQRPNPMTKFRKPVVTLPSFRMPQLSSGLLASGAFVAAAGVAVLIAWGAAVLALGLATAVLSLFGTAGAALTLGARRGGRLRQGLRAQPASRPWRAS